MLRDQAKKIIESDLKIAGYKAASIAANATLTGPRLGYSDFKKFNTSVEYGGRICCRKGKDGNPEYFLTGPYTTGGMNSIRTGGFAYRYNFKDPKDTRYLPEASWSESFRNRLNKLTPLLLKKDQAAINQYNKLVKHTGYPDKCPKGSVEKAAYHSHFLEESLWEEFKKTGSMTLELVTLMARGEH